MARELQSDFGASLSHFIKKTLQDPAFIQKHKGGPKAFTRRSKKLPFETLFLFLLFPRQRAAALELNDFLTQLQEVAPSSQRFDDSAFFHARKKIRPDAFSDLNDRLIQHYRNCVGMKKWKGFELVAVDGTTARLPKTPDVLKTFPAESNKHSSECQPLCRIVSLFAVQERFNLATEIAPYRTGETSMFMALTDKLQAGQILVADRGFDAPWIFSLVHSRQCEFVIRLAKGAFKKADEFRESGLEETVVTLPLRGKSKTRCKDLGLDTSPITLRLLRVELENGEVEVLCTSLLDASEFSHSDISDVYRMRWGAEEQFKHQKCRFEVENFTGKSCVAALQDLCAAMLSNNLMLMFSALAQDSIDKRTAGRRYSYTTCWAKALGFFKRQFGRLLHVATFPSDALLSYIEFCAETAEPIRPGRRYPRKHKRRRNYYMAYKPVV